MSAKGLIVPTKGETGNYQEDDYILDANGDRTLWRSAFPDTIALCRIAVQMPPQPPLPESRSRECRHSSSYRLASPAASTSASRPTAKVNAILAKQSALEKKLQEQEETKS